MCCVVVCDLETSRMGAPYIYDISRLRVKKTKVPHRPASTVTKFRNDGLPNLCSFRSFQLVTLLAERKAWQNHPPSFYTLAADRYV